jgi:hypothetical protein
MFKKARWHYQRAFFGKWVGREVVRRKSAPLRQRVVVVGRNFEGFGQQFLAFGQDFVTIGRHSVVVGNGF